MCVSKHCHIFHVVWLRFSFAQLFFLLSMSVSECVFERRQKTSTSVPMDESKCEMQFVVRIQSAYFNKNYYRFMVADAILMIG